MYIAAYKNPVLHTCPECQKEFSTALRRQKYCSQKCRSAHHLRVKHENYVAVKSERRSRVYTMACEGCGAEFTYRLFENSKPRRFCDQACYHSNKGLTSTEARTKPKGILTSSDFAAIQLIWHTFDYVPLSIFPDTREVREIHDSLFSKEMFHEWVVYTIVIQAHMMWRYETIVQIPGLVKADFLRLCQKYRITLQDSAAFAEDIKAVA